MPFNLKFISGESWILSLLLFSTAFILFIFLAHYLKNNYVVNFDQSVLTWFHTIRHPYLDHFFSTITWMGSLWILLPLYLVLTLTLTPHIAHFEKILGITFWGTVITVYALKFEFERKRPLFFGAIHELPLDPSFPSAHTAQITAFALGLTLALAGTQTLYQGVISSLLLVLVLSVSASRMYLQVHFPTDIVAGMLIAFMWAVITGWIVKTGVLG
ncbi:MAG: phosphatase PAP2 family protein [Sulfuricurvum sp.]|uniref:phosphatase PAP2 family protein n=1 Tax=Sulfuricurvum sp. TaxID=2025608 RepID=UPI0027322E73|nr:phosphatase PAP2 family protein [Sulfuricurvum sp.]MDP2849702.1 phosphatase PAP2 family protein [Sulfuricurvum sp.]